MRIAFDCQGVLIADGPTPAILETRTRGLIMPQLVELLVKGGAEVHCISAAPANHPTAYSALCQLLGQHRIPVHGIWPVFHGPNATPRDIGHLKADKMQELGCEILFDDIPDICEVVRSRGLIAINYSTNWEQQ